MKVFVMVMRCPVVHKREADLRSSHFGASILRRAMEVKVLVLVNAGALVRSVSSNNIRQGEADNYPWFICY